MKAVQCLSRRLGGTNLLQSPMSDVTRILERVEQGDGKAAEELLPLVYEELRKLAAARMPRNPQAKPCNPPRWFMKPG